jgi:PAS domain S-box-containing protein
MAQRNIRWNLVGTGVGFMLLFWVIDAFFGSVFSGTDRQFWYELTHPEIYELLTNLFINTILLLFIRKLWLKSDLQDQLYVSLQVALADLATEKKRTEAILAAIPDAVTVQDLDLKIVYQNSVMKEILGDWVGEYCYQAYHQLSAPCPNCPLLRSLADGQFHTLERQHGDKPARHFEITATPLMDSAGNIIAGIESVREITTRKQTENRLRQQLAAIETSMDGIAILSVDGEYLYLNNAHAAVYGYDAPSELLGKSWHVLYTDTERQRLEPLIYEGFQREGGWRGEGAGLKKDGSLYQQEISLSLLDDGGIICVVRDITERKRSEEKIGKLNKDLARQTIDLMTTNKELEAFGYSLSHDLRSSLSVIYMAIQAFDDLIGAQVDETGKALILAIHRGCVQTENLIEAMQVLFRVGRAELSKENVDLSAMGNEILLELHMHHPDRKVDWNIDKGMVVYADPHLLRILLGNLLGNAWKYTQKIERPKIEFGRRWVDGEIRYFIQDNGAGFDMSNADRMFKPFQRLHSSDEFPGTGIGLATSQRIIERHEGSIWAVGEKMKGATIFFTLQSQGLAEAGK